MATVILTGASGFVGSHVLEHLLVNTNWDIICIESFRHKGVAERITDSKHYKKNDKRVTVYTHDLTTPFSEVLIQRLPEINTIFNVASESHVTRSIEDPVAFIQNNVNLALNMLELARKIKPKKFIHVSTDEVYGPCEGEPHKEWDTHYPSSPYAASKSAQESICFAYWRTFGVPVFITNTMNIYGERQDTEKYLPLIIKKVVSGEPLTVHTDEKGNPGTRFWLHARNQADALLYIAKNIDPNVYGLDSEPSKYHVVGDIELDNLAMAQKVAEIIGKPLRYVLVDANLSRPGHDARYAMSGRKLAEAGWKAPVGFEETLRSTIEWTMKHPEWLF